MGVGVGVGRGVWVGVGLGVAFYYALIGRKTISPLDIKLSNYKRAVMNERAAREAPRDD